jgi:hypothetical protein
VAGARPGKRRALRALEKKGLVDYEPPQNAGGVELFRSRNAQAAGGDGGDGGGDGNNGRQHPLPPLRLGFEAEAAIATRRAAEMEKLDRMLEFAAADGDGTDRGNAMGNAMGNAARCRRKYLLEYFGDEAASSFDRCGNCDLCRRSGVTARQ